MALANKCILRVAPLNDGGKISRATVHNTRTAKEAPYWVDETRSHLNEIHGAKNYKELRAALDKRLETVNGRKIQHNSVRLAEYIVTRSPDDRIKNLINDQDYLKSAKEWIEKKHGKDNVLSVTMHYDETTPHLHALVVPIQMRENKKGVEKSYLSYRGIFCDKKGISKDILSQMQTDFHQDVAKQFGLDRGKFKSTDRNIPLKEYRQHVADGRQEDFSKMGKKQIINKANEIISALDFDVRHNEEKYNDNAKKFIESKLGEFNKTIEKANKTISEKNNKIEQEISLRNRHKKNYQTSQALVRGQKEMLDRVASAKPEDLPDIQSDVKEFKKELQRINQNERS